MKRIAAIFLTTFYLLATVGVAFSVHFCDGQVNAINVYAKTSDCCCGDEESMAECCDDEQFFFQLDTEQKTIQTFRVNTKEIVHTISNSVVTKFLVPTEEQNTFPDVVEHPLPAEQPIWLLNCSLTYYG